MTPEEQYIQISQEIDELKKKQENLKKEILSKHTVNGEIIPGLRRVCNRNLNADKLKKNVTDAQWRRITERKIVTSYLTAEIKRGTIDKNIVDSCREDGDPYIKRV